MKNSLPIRNSIKILLINQSKQLLLISIDDKSIKNTNGEYNGKFWQILGGKIEPGETLEQAAHRELFEETGLNGNDVTWGPIVWFGEVKLQMNGVTTLVKQQFIIANTFKNTITTNNLTPEEKDVVKELKWMSLDEIKNCNDIIYPVVLPEYLPDIINENYPKSPIFIDLSKQPNK